MGLTAGKRLISPLKFLPQACLPRLLQVVVLPPVVAQRGDNFSVGSYVSDLAELVSGWCHVFIQTPKENTMIDLRQLDTADAQSIDKLTVKIGPKLFGKRVEVSPAAHC